MCSVFGKRLIVLATVAVVALSGILLCVPTAQAATYESEYLVDTVYIRDVFPEYISVYTIFFSDFNYSGTQYQLKDYDITYGPDTWPYVYVETDRVSLVGSAYFGLWFDIDGAVFDANKTYVFDFTMKFDDWGIGCAYNLSSIGIQIDLSSETSVYYYPLSVWTEKSHTYAHFKFNIEGRYLAYSSDSLDNRYFFFHFNAAHSGEKKSPFIRMWIDPNYGFSVRTLTSEEVSADLTGQATADAIGNIGSDIELPDTSGTLNNAGELMSKLDVEKDYKIDPNESAELLNNSSALFKQSDFTNAFGFIDNCVQRFVDTSEAMYLFFISILGLGVAFAALGRSL